MKNNVDKRRNWRDTLEYSESKTIPGQSLIPAELLKRHLAGTLPEIDQTSMNEYHYDENGEQIGEPLPVEMHELHKLAVAIRKRQFEEATEHRRKEAEKFKQRIIDEYKSTLASADPEGDATSKNPPAGA